MMLRSVDEPFHPGKSRRVASGDKGLRLLSRSYFPGLPLSFVESAAYARPLAGLRILARAVEERFRQIVRNGGGGSAVVLDNVDKRVGSFGYNAATEEYGDLVEFGVIDPAKVTRLALQNAVSVAGLLLTTEVAVTSAR